MIETCCRLALDKPTRLPGDLIMYSWADDNQLELAYAEEELSELPEFMNNDSKNTPYDTPLDPTTVTNIPDVSHNHSDHVFVQRKFNGYICMSANVSFAQLLNEAQGSEVLFVKSRKTLYDKTSGLFASYIGDMQTKPHILGIQEYVVLPALQEALRSMKYTLYETKSRSEGSCIAVKSNIVNESLTNLIFELRDEHLNDHAWAVGVTGRTFSAAVVDVPNATLVLNVHAPNPSDANHGGWHKNKKELNSKMNTVSRYLPDNAKNMFKTDAFQKGIRMFMNKWLSSVLGGESESALHNRLAYIFTRCNYRLILMGDFNDASWIY
jgi:hypothetical protein